MICHIIVIIIRCVRTYWFENARIKHYAGTTIIIVIFIRITGGKVHVFVLVI